MKGSRGEEEEEGVAAGAGGGGVGEAAEPGLGVMEESWEAT